MAKQQQRIAPFEWDPSNPSCLLLLPEALPNDDPQSLETIRHYVVTDGTCSDKELSALLQILTSHADHHRSDRERTVSQSEDWKNLSREYRKAIKECVEAMRDDNDDDDVVAMAGDNDDDPQNDQQQGQPERITNDGLLRHMFATLHLSEIFIPLTSTKWEHESPYNKEGYVTADTVRYLRLLYVVETPSFFLRHADGDAIMVPDADIDLMYNMDQPDKFRSDDGAFYWQYMEHLVRTGRLEEAAELLLRHSLYATTTSEDLKREFLHLCSILLVAPIPGGRNCNYDDGLETIAFGDEDFLVLEEGPTVADIGVEDFKHWETGINQDIHYSSFAAINAHRTWQEKILRLSLPSLQRYLPTQISGILHILAGHGSQTADVPPALQLLEELLYKSPNWTPIKVAARATALGMADFDTRIMYGDVLEVLYQLNLGGSSSGAALPSTLYSLIVSLYSDADVLPEDWDTTGYVKTELLCNASYDIVTSLSDSNPDIGAQQAVRLLLPYALNEGKSEYVASIATILESYVPSSENYARTIISLCEPLIKLKSVEVLQGCTDVLLCIYQKSNVQENFDVAVSVLIQGLKLEAKVYSSPYHGSCFKAMKARCALVSSRLVESLIASEPDDELQARGLEACSYKSAFLDPRSELDLLKFPHVSQLCAVLALFEVVNMNAPSNVVADRVAECLEGLSAKVLTPRLHDDIVRVLKKVISEKDGDRLVVRSGFRPSEPVKATKLKWAEIEILRGDNDLEFERMCLDEFVSNVIAKNSERANAVTTRFGSTTDMRSRPSRPFNEMSETEKRAHADYLNKKFVI